MYLGGLTFLFIDMIIDTYKKQLSILRHLGYTESDEYVCPFCLRSFTDVSLISLEDAPQEALGGSKIALTCKECNNKLGGLVDCHLVNYIVDKEDRLFPKEMVRSFTFHDKKRGRDIQGKIEVNKTGEIRMIFPEKVNDPKVLNAAVKEIKKGDIIGAEMRVNLSKRMPRNIVAALLKNAYILLFSYFGYSFLLNSFYDCFRDQINAPEKEIVPEGLISVEGAFNALKDGIYVCDDMPLRGFFVVFTLKKREGHKYGVFIPAIINGLEPAIEAARLIEKGDMVVVSEVEKSPFFWENQERIERLILWSTNEKMKWTDVVS